MEEARNVDIPSSSAPGSNDDGSSVPTAHDSISESTFPLDSVFEEVYDKVANEIARPFHPIQYVVYYISATILCWLSFFYFVYVFVGSDLVCCFFYVLIYGTTWG